MNLRNTAEYAKRFLGIMVLAIVMPVLSGVLTGCDEEVEAPPQTTDQATYPMTITDHAGRNITLDAEPATIISLLPSHTEIVFALGLGDKVVGVDEYSNYPNAALNKKNVGNLYAVNYEEIVAANPDIILVDISAVDLGVVDQLTTLLPESNTVVVKGTKINSFQEVYETIELIGMITDSSDEAEKIVSDMKNRVQAVTDKTDVLTEAQKVKTVYIIWHEPLYVHGGDALGSALIEAAGGTNIFVDNEGDAVQLEELVDRDPQVILASASESMGDLAYQFALNDPNLENTEARVNDAIYGMDDDLTGRPGPRLVEGLEAMAKLLHPELFD